jgi:methylated-DNA-[protein]-cysteine S-methyltransferase
MKFDPAIVQDCFDSPLGNIIIAASPQGLAGLWFDGQRHLPKELLAPTLATACASLPPGGAGSPWDGPAVESLSPTWPKNPEHPVIKSIKAQLAEYFAGRRSRFEIALDLSGGTAFQQAVWQALLVIPRGTTASYGALSARIGKPAAVRAVGAAVGRNPISIVVPCHRVMGADGSLTGYAGGLARKSSLLHLEGVTLTGDQG